MATLCEFKPKALQFIPKKSASPSATKLINDTQDTDNEHVSPLLRNNKKTTGVNIEQIWTHYETICVDNRLQNLVKCDILPPDMWQVVLEYEFDQSQSYSLFIEYMYKQIKKLHILPWLIGMTQFGINAFVLSQFPEVIGLNIESTPSPTSVPAPTSSSSLYVPAGRAPTKAPTPEPLDEAHAWIMYCCGIALAVASLIQLLGALINLLYIYNKTNYNIRTLAILKGCMFLNNNIHHRGHQRQHRHKAYIFNENNGWELFIEFEKWCNVLYVNDLLSNKEMVTKGTLFKSDIIWMYFCKPIYCLIYGIFLTMQTIEIVMWIWIPLIIIQWYCGLHTFLKIGSGSALFVCLSIGALSYCAAIYFHHIIVGNVTFDIAIILTMFVNAGIVGGVALAAIICYYYSKKRPRNDVKKYLYIHWIVISAIFTISYLIEFGINFMSKSKYEKTIWLCLLRLFGMYFWYLSFNLGILLCGNVEKYKNFDPKKFIMSCWFLGWFDLHCISHVFHEPYSHDDIFV